MKKISPDNMLRKYFSLINNNDHEEIEKLKSESKKFRSVVESYLRPFHEWKTVKIVKIDKKKGIESFIEQFEEALKSFKSMFELVLNNIYVIHIKVILVDLSSKC